MPPDITEIWRRVGEIERSQSEAQRTQMSNIERLVKIEQWIINHTEKHAGVPQSQSLSTWAVIAVAIAISLMMFGVLAIVMRPGL